jgi:hypothetical protein
MEAEELSKQAPWTPTLGFSSTNQTSNVLLYYVSLRSKFRVVMSAMISASKRCSVRIYPQLFVGGLTTHLRYLCLLT